MLRRDDNRRPGRFLPSPALKARLAATESALAAAKSEREEAAKRLETAKAKHRDLLNSQVVYPRTPLEDTSDPKFTTKVGRVVRAGASCGAQSW